MLDAGGVWRRRRRFVTLIATSAMLWLYPILARADTGLSDPKSWADGLVRLIAARDQDAVLNALAESSGDVEKERFKVGLAQFWEILPGTGEILSTDLIAQREWGKSLVMYWYYLDFKDKIMVVSLRLRKHGDGWQLNQFNFTTDMDNAKLP